MNIAIIGAGVSGLTTAYYLMKNAPAGTVNITIYEASAIIGGNADTVEVSLPMPDGSLKSRWVDFGVNDFNLSTYTALVTLWEELGIMQDMGQSCPESSYCSPLIDTESFAFPGQNNDYAYRYTVQADGSIVSPPGSTAKADILYNDIQMFEKLLAQWYTDHKPEKDYHISVAEWLAMCNYRFSEDFINYNLYPRINGMYFTVEQPIGSGIPVPSAMPMWMVGHYYILQEAYGQKITPDCPRQYFVGGSVRWLDVLATTLVGMGVTIQSNTPIDAIASSGDQMVVVLPGGSGAFFDKVVLATHADTTLKLMNYNFSGDTMVQLLGGFNYSTCPIYIHQDPRFLAQRDFDCTYNIHAYDYTQQLPTFPYTISYIVNYHQNDPAAGINDPLFFLSINPYWTQGQAPANMLNFADGSGPAIGSLSHCTLNTTSLNAQIGIFDIQFLEQADRQYYFCGSFTVGAGLHEECILNSIDMATKILNPSWVPPGVSKGGKRDSAPQYILDAIKRMEAKKKG
ncbi:MAG: oleate hydratase [Bacteroidota bacterium]